MTWAATILLALAVDDPRIAVSDLVLKEQDRAALRASETVLDENPEQGRELGLDYLRGYLLNRMGRSQEAAQAYGQALLYTPPLKPYAHFRLAVHQERLGHPEMATGMAATLLGTNPPRFLVRPATELLARTLAKGGDCAHIEAMSFLAFPAAERRLMDFARADCALRAGRVEEANRHLITLLQENRTDLVARRAAERIARISPSPNNLQVVFLLGMTFHGHRDFVRSTQYLRQVVVESAPPARGAESPQSARVHLNSEEFDLRYRMIRSLFWQDRFAVAAAGYGELAELTRSSRNQAMALFHQGRSYELAGNWGAASASYRRAYLADPEGIRSGAALISALRLEWRTGKRDSAQELWGLLVSQRRWRADASQAALFAATSELVRGRAEEAGDWLAQAEKTGERRDAVELAYWRGRVAEAKSRRDDAMDDYLRALRIDPYHPLSQAARQRLEGEDMAGAVGERVDALASSSRIEDLFARWVLLGEDDPAGARARRQLEAGLLAQRASAAFMQLEVVPVRDWPLWQQTLTRPSEMLLALGIWQEGAPAVRRHFPVNVPALAFTASQHLRSAGEVHGSLLIAQILSQRIPPAVPPQFLPTEYRRLLYPNAYAPLVRQAATRRSVDAHLLTAIIREESSFDPDAVSDASARGLTQFVFSTAQGVAERIGYGPIAQRDLENPEIAIELGAAYLAHLGQRFPQAPHQVIAAYNAGEPQARIWGSYCYSQEPEEFLTKVNFPETRRYLIKVLASRAQYAELYRQEVAGPPLKTAVNP